MADEPILCFDGDGAGRRAAGRAADIALPHVKPGKSLRFAALPEGQDPDDLVRSGGRDAIAAVLAAARPLADLLWTKEVESGGIDTPERRAGLEARLNGLTSAIEDQTVRRYYRQEFWQRLRNLASPRPSGRPAAGSLAAGATDADKRRHGNAASRRYPTRPSAGGRGAETSLAPSSPQLEASPIVRGARQALPPREALILLATFNHPWLLETQAEQLAELEFENSDADLLRRVILDITGSLHAEQLPDAAALRDAVIARNCGGALQRIERAVTHLADWPARAGAAPQDVRQMWTHVLTLHRRNRTLHKELKEAERALGADLSEQNFAWLQDVQAQLASLEGTEATIEGFGTLSGRPSGGP